MNPTKAERLLFRAVVGLAAFALVALVALALTGCATRTVPGPTVYEKVQVPVAAPCLKAADIPAKPDLSTPDQLRAMTPVERVKHVLADWFASRAYEGELEAALRACASP